MRKLALVLALMVASTAFGAIQYGVVGSGTYAAPNVSSESYDWYVDYDWDSVFPLPTDNPAGNKAPSGFEGYILLALNPYTGDIWTDIPVQYQAAGGVGAGYTGHASSLTGTPLTNYDPAGDVSQDCIYIQAEHRWDGGGGYFGSFIGASADGGILTDGYDGEFPAGLNNWYAKGHSVGDTIDAGAGTWISGTSDHAFGHVGAHNWMWYTGTGGGGSATLGFQMDGIEGWMSLSFSGDRSGVTLNEYYFDVPEPATMSLLGLGGIAALIRRRK
jgi:hypothetical protein